MIYIVSLFNLMILKDNFCTGIYFLADLLCFALLSFELGSERWR